MFCLLRASTTDHSIGSLLFPVLLSRILKAQKVPLQDSVYARRVSTLGPSTLQRMHILDTTGEQPSGSAFRAPPTRSTSASAKKRMMDLLQNILLKVKKSLKNHKAPCMNQKAITTHLSMITPEDPFTLLSISEDDSEEEAADEAPLKGVEDEVDDGVADGDEEDADEDDEDEEEGEDEDEDYDG